MQCALLLDVVFRDGATVLQLLAGGHETLLIWRYALFVLCLGVRSLDIQAVVLPVSVFTKICMLPRRWSMQVQSTLLLDVVYREGTAVLQLLAGEDQTLLIWRDALYIMVLGLAVVSDQVQSGLLLHVVFREVATVL